MLKSNTNPGSVAGDVYWGVAAQHQHEGDPMYLLSEGEFVALTQLVFEVEGWAAAFQTSSLQEGDAITQHLSLIQVVGGHDDRAIWDDP